MNGNGIYAYTMKDIKHSKPLRTCAGTGAKLPQSGLLRFVGVKGVPTPEFYLHPTKRAPGRGVYVLPNPEALALAVKKKAFAHKLKTNRPPPEWNEIAARLVALGSQKLDNPAR